MDADFNEGWICLHRKIVESMVFQNEGLLKVWIWCLTKANHETTWIPIVTGRGNSVVKVDSGQFIFGRKKAAKELKMNESTIYKRMKILKKHENLTIESNNHYSVISIINWNSYQDKKKESSIESNRQGTCKEQASNTYNNDNNDNNKTTASPLPRDAEARAREYSTEQILMSDTKISNLGKSSEVPVCPHQVIIDAYHFHCPSLPRVESWSEASQRVLAARWREKRERQEIAWWRGYFQRVDASAFLTGRVKDFAANLNWLIGPKNMEKVLNGFYDNRKAVMPERLRNNIEAGMEFINGAGGEA